MQFDETIDRISSQFEEDWRNGKRPSIRDYLNQVDPTSYDQLLHELILVEIQLSECQQGEAILSKYRAQFHEMDDKFWENIRCDLNEVTVDTHSIESTLLVNPDRKHRSSAERAGESPEGLFPSDLKRYRPKRILGSGAFGTVFLAEDQDLERLVAIKVPHDHIDNCDDYVSEARVLASLDHQSIVPVYDVYRLDDGRPVVISKYIVGRSLKTALEQTKFSYAQSARIVAHIAEALHYAHMNGVIHRDIKPANILWDEKSTPFVVDFGMALRFQNVVRPESFAGTPQYMSPEQARGESTLVDGRSDVFSLGVVLYEMLTGDRPFQGGMRKLLHNIVKQEARPPRSIDDRIPRDLENICLKALSKHMVDRYSTAGDMAQDLRKCMTYVPAPINVDGIELPESLAQLLERLSENNHDVWSQQRIQGGWEFGDVRDDIRKTHPDLVPYDQLTEEEKELDRQTVIYTLKAIIALGYSISDSEERHSS